MYKYQMTKLFKKLWYFILVAVILIACSKLFVMKFAYPACDISKQGLEQIDKLCEETLDYTPDERLSYINKWSAEYTEKFFSITDPTAKQQKDFDVKEEARNYYQNQLRNNAYVLEGVKNYIHTGEGFTSAAYPQDLADNPKAYSSLATPQSVNEYYFTRFLSLQSYNVCPFLILLLIGIFVCDSYEKRMDLQVKISFASKLFSKSREVVLCCFVLGISLLNLAYDMIISGMASHSQYFSAPIQSVNDYVFLPENMTIGGAVFRVFILEVLAAFVCFNIFILLAQKIRSVRNYLICTAAIVGIFTILPKFFPDLSIYCFMGMNDKAWVLSDIKYIAAFGGTNLFLVFAVFLMVLSGLCCWRMLGYRNNK